MAEQARYQDSQLSPTDLDKLGGIVRDFRIEDKKTGELVSIYEPEIVLAKLGALPAYVGETMLSRLADPNANWSYDKIVLDKWGKKDARTKKYAETPEVVMYRAASLVAVGQVEKNPSLNYEQQTRAMFDMFSRREVFPNTPFMANGAHRQLAEQLEQKLGEDVSPALKNELAQEKKIRPQLFACFVLPIYDSRQALFDTLSEAAHIQAEIGGTGFNFSNLRPANEMIHGTGGTTDGPLSFMSMYATSLGTTMNQGGKRDGANMFMLNVNHPDIMRFLYAKRKDGEIAAANMSVALDHDFMRAAMAEGEDRFYPLVNPHHNPETRPHIPKHYSVEQLRQAIEITKQNKKAKLSLLLSEDGTQVLSPWLHDGLGEEFKAIGKVGSDGAIYLDARKVMKHIAFGAWYSGEPGVIFTGTINDANPTHPKHYLEWILEQKDSEAREIADKIKAGLPDGESLEEGARDFVYARSDDGRYVNLPTGIGMLEATNPCGEKPLIPFEACALGHINLEQVLAQDSSSSSGYKIDWGKLGAHTRLMYEILDNAIDQNQFTIPQISDTQRSNRKIGLGVMGLANMLYKLEVPYGSPEARKLVEEVMGFIEKESDAASFERGENLGAFPNFRWSAHRKGRPKRNAIVRTIAPTGTTGFVAKTTGGIEPEYALSYKRLTVQGTEIPVINPILAEKEKRYPFLSGEEERTQFLEYVQSHGTVRGYELRKAEGEDDVSFSARQANLAKIRRIFATSHDLSPSDHVQMQAVVQRHIDDAISKTTNFKNNASVQDVENALFQAYELGVKGLTFYRDGTRRDQPLQIKGDKPQNLEQQVAVGGAVHAKKRPDTLEGDTTKKKTGCGNLFVTINSDGEVGEDGVPRPFEAFLNLGKPGGCAMAMTQAVGRLASMCFRLGADPKEVASQVIGIGCGKTVGIGKDRASCSLSCVDSFGKAIAEYVGAEVVDESADSDDFEAVSVRSKSRDNGGKTAQEIISTAVRGDPSAAGSGTCPKCNSPMRPSDGCMGGICTNPLCQYSECG